MGRVSVDLESSLSIQEKKIARLLAWGYTQKEIADKLFVSPLTISTHLRNIYRKLSIHKETDLCRWWIFFEYSIADNPLKKVVAVFLLALSIHMIVHETNMLRVFRSFSSRAATRSVSAFRARRRYENVFDLHLALTV
jgi:DNA-binding CsgD family transcriptional regulator